MPGRHQPSWLDRAVLSALSRLLPAPFGGCGWCHRNAAALARPTRRSPLDLPAPTTRSTICRITYPSSRPAHGPRGSPPGYSRIHGEMVGLGHVLAASTVLKGIRSAGLVDDGHGADLGAGVTTRCPRSARASRRMSAANTPRSAQARSRSDPPSRRDKLVPQPIPMRGPAAGGAGGLAS